MKIGKAIAAARERAGLSQVELAQKLGVSAGTVAGWEVDTHDFRFKRLGKIARALGMTPAELVAEAS